MGSTGDEASGPRAFVAVKLGERSWVVDLPRGEIGVGSAEAAGMVLPAEGVEEQHFMLRWDGERLALLLAEARHIVFLNGKRLDASTELKPGDEIAVGGAQLVVGVAVAPSTAGRRALTHHEFRERLYEEVARASRGGRPTTLVMFAAPPGEGGKIAAHALARFRAGDVLGTYAHDELEILLPDTTIETAEMVIDRLRTETQAEAARAGLAVAPDHGDSPERLLRSARLALTVARAGGPPIALPPPHKSGDPPPEVKDPASRGVREALQNLADEDVSILLTGEVSSGKALFARLLHNTGKRQGKPFVVVSCASIPEAQEAAFFQTKASQDSLLVALDDAGDVRIVASTHRALAGLVEREAFDAALYERLAGHIVELPPLRNRPEDIIPLAETFAAEYGAPIPVRMAPGALARLRSHPWPGNVLELRNAMERAVRLANGAEILADHLPVDALPASGDGRLREHVDSVERDAIIKALADSNYNQTHAAKRLGVSRRALIYKMEKYGLKPPPGQARRG
ncbi:MAG: sigma 54-interacting transcriptional regulator [Deltaproteobacteria bacterium]|nr:sigma 54-interacting transcriptional regulator [Deltaproteobacteria bacterium]